VIEAVVKNSNVLNGDGVPLGVVGGLRGHFATPLRVWLKEEFLCHSESLMMCQRQRPSIHVFMVLWLTEPAAWVDMNVDSRISAASMWISSGTEKLLQNLVKWMRPAG